MSAPITFRVITKISGTDPHKECSVTLSQKSTKELAMEIYQNLWSEAEASGNLGLWKRSELLKEYYHERLVAWREWNEEDERPDLGELPSEAQTGFTGTGQEPMAIDLVSTYDFHYFIEEREWNPKEEDLEITINEH